MLSKTLRKRKKKTQGTTRKHNQPTPPKTCTRSLSTGEESAVGQIERYVFRVTHTTHFCYMSTGPLLLLFFFCSLNTTMPTDDKKQPRYDTPHQPHTASTHTHTHGSHTVHDPPPRRPHQHKAPQHGHRARPHTPQTHTTRDTPTRETHHHNRQAPARGGGEPHTTTAGGPQPGVAGNHTKDPQPGVTRNAQHHRQQNPARSGGE